MKKDSAMGDFLKKARIKIIQKEASWVLAKYKPFVIAITGTVGKTSTKDAIYTALHPSLSVERNVKSFNGELGTPLAILRITDGTNSLWQWIKNVMRGISLILFPHKYPEYLVLEVGAGRPNEIKEITAWLKPNIAVITKLSKVPVHVEFFKSPADVIVEKSYLAQATRADGTVILNADDADVVAFKNLTKAKTIFFGLAEDATLRAENYRIMYDKSNFHPIGVEFYVSAGGKKYPVTLNGSIGRHHMYPILAALSVGITLKLSMENMVKALSAHQSPPGRMRIIEGIRESTVIDDSYNASPVAVGEAIATLHDLHTDGRKIMVIGTMAELGTYSEEAHRTAGSLMVGTCTYIIGVGAGAGFYIDEAIKEGFKPENTKIFQSSMEACEYIRLLIKENDIVLVKGSQSVRMERIVERIMKNPEKKKDLLVRQDDYWKKQ